MSHALERSAQRDHALAILLAGGALGVQAAASHAGAIGGAVGHALVFGEVLHVLAAGAWLGALLPLLIVLANSPTAVAAVVLRRFFPLGLIAVSIIGATSVVQAIEFVGSVPALIGTPYGHTVMFKLGLFLAMLVLATMNRFVFRPTSSRWLRRSVAGEAALAVGLMVAAGSLAHMTPGTHEQAVWPFLWRINSAPAEAWLVPANPASYFVSPTGFAAAAIVRGEGVFQSGCTDCHGASGRGDGRLAATLPVYPADLTDRRLLTLSDGDLYWRVGHAMDLAEDTRWDLVDYLRAHNRGEFLRTSGRGMPTLHIPRFSATCGDGRNLIADDLRDRTLHIMVPGPSQPMPSISAGTAVVMIALAAGADEPCLAQPEALVAFAILLGSTPAGLAGSRFLIDPNGWLRGRWRPGEAGGWGTPALLMARIRAVTDHPLPPDTATRPHRH